MHYGCCTSDRNMVRVKHCENTTGAAIWLWIKYSIINNLPIHLTILITCIVDREKIASLSQLHNDFGNYLKILQNLALLCFRYVSDDDSPVPNSLNARRNVALIRLKRCAREFFEYKYITKSFEPYRLSI